ncbi:cardiolipin synthase [uncultured Hoeflea sp.]|uniref:cardiolipin synthase n=1 Tax=uncultured Hoeflea sp. TaxID=538666 RepID=UPI0030EB8F32|tara:strand:- start:11201 stop:12622 length:1422 start_codon:yes stop_codon:yes gene_type:complete
MAISLNIFSLVVVPLFYAVGVVFALVAISQERSSQGAVAWTVALVAMPFVSVPLFVVFGGWRFSGYVKKFRTQLARTPISRDLLPDPLRLTDTDLGAMQVIEKLARFPFTRGNEVDLLIDAEETYAALFQSIDRATRSILMQFYIINDDDAGREFAQRLIGAAERGVEVRVLYDEIGCNRTPEAYFSRLRDAGISVSPFGSATRMGKRFQINFRNHRKIAVFDGQIGFTGGLNIGDEYLGNSKGRRSWRDTHLRFTGPTVKAAQFSFLEDWHWATGEQLELDWSVPAIQDDAQTALFLATGPADKNDTFKLFVVQAINAAQESIWIATPYFVPDEEVITALHLAVMRGVEVRLLVPETSDHWVVGLAVHAWIDRALSNGAKVHRYQPGFMHQKVMLIDDRFSSLGSGNMDNRSFRLNFEASLLVLDEEFARQTKAMLERDFERSEPMPAGHLASRPLLFRLMVNLARLASPLL